MTVRRPFDKLRVPGTVEPSAPLRLDPERCPGGEGRVRRLVAAADRLRLDSQSRTIAAEVLMNDAG